MDTIKGLCYVCQKEEQAEEHICNKCMELKKTDSLEFLKRMDKNYSYFGDIATYINQFLEEKEKREDDECFDGLDMLNMGLVGFISGLSQRDHELQDMLKRK